MIVVSDTTAITNLISIEKAGLLRQLYGQVFIPDAVLAELRVKHLEIPDFIQNRSISDLARAEGFISNVVDAGEAEAIVLAEELRADYLLIDEIAGRALARSHGLRVTGLLGVLLRAKEHGLVSAIRPLLDDLQNTAGFWVSGELRDHVLREAGET